MVDQSEQQAVPVAQIDWRDPIGVLPFGGGALIPAVVVAGPDVDGDYRVSFRDKGNHGYLRGLQWFRDDGTACGATGHRVIQAWWDAASLTGFEFATKVRDPFPQPHIEATKLALTATPETFPHDSYSLAQWLDKALFTPVPPEDDATQTRETDDARIREIAEAIYAEVADEPLGDLTQRRQAVQDSWHDAVRAAFAGSAGQ